ncbi:Hypothetical protein FKW44_002592, partial [Caligus rogercresseyi]
KIVHWIQVWAAGRPHLLPCSCLQRLRSDPFASYTICNANLLSHNFQLLLPQPPAPQQLTIRASRVFIDEDSSKSMSLAYLI